MIVTSLNQPREIILVGQWLEESCAQLKSGNLIWLDREDEHQRVTSWPFTDEDFDDECLHFEYEEIKGKYQTINEVAQQLCELESSEFIQDSSITLPYKIKPKMLKQKA
jgi:hypothetical protein